MVKEKHNDGLSAEPTLVVGLGKTGLSCVHFLVTNGVPVAVVDSRDNPPCLDDLRHEYKQIEYSVGGFDKNLFDWARRIVVSPGVSVTEPLIAAAVGRGVEVIGDVELFARLAEAPIIAITGSNGKSTVTTLLTEMVKSSGKDVLMGGNIGIPVLDLLQEPVPDFYVLELSSFQLETTYTLGAAVSVVLNVSPDHMDRYADFKAYADAKQRIYGLEGFDHGLMVVNRDDETVMSMIKPGRHFTSFGLDEASNSHFGRVMNEGEVWLSRGDQPLLAVSELRMAGEHNQANALAALALGDAIGLPMVVMLNVLRSFRGLPHRTQWVAKINGVSWINDSKGTNVGATLSAIVGFENPVVLIAGGQGKGADFSVLRDVVEKNARAVVLFGEDATLIEQALGECVQILHASDIHDAVQKAHSVAQRGDVVLFSPACASFDMFKNFEARGEAYIEAVLDLQDGGAS